MSIQVKLKQIENIQDLLSCCDEASREWEWLSGNLGTTGLDSGETDAAELNGNSTPKEMYLSAHSTKDIRIYGIQVAIICSSPKLHYFGGVDDELNNGVDILYNKNGTNRYIVQAAKKNSDFIIQTGIHLYLGGESDDDFTGIFPNWGNSSDIFFAFIDVVRLMGGIKLKAGTSDKLSAIINDNLRGEDDDKLQEVYFRVFASDSDAI